MRRLRLIIVIPTVIVLVFASGGIFLWFIGGKTLSSQTVQVATDNALLTASAQKTSPAFLSPPTYRLEEIPVSAGDDSTALTNYGRAVAYIMSVYNDKGNENELTLVIKAAEKTDPQAVAKLAAIAARHGETALRLKALVVPPSSAQVHLNLINSIIGLAESSYLMAQIDEGPVVALGSAQIYPTRLKNFFTSVNNLNFFLLANNVVLPESERSVISLGL